MDRPDIQRVYEEALKMYEEALKIGGENEDDVFLDGVVSALGWVLGEYDDPLEDLR
jgi:hypothetical protein